MCHFIDKITQNCKNSGKKDEVMKRFKTLKSKLVFSSVIILVIAIVVNLAVSISLSYMGMRRNVEKDLKSIGQTAQVAVTNSISLMKEKISFVATSGGIGGSNPDESNKNWLTSFEQKKYTYGYKMLYVADKSGKILSSNAAYNGKDIADTEYFKQAANGKTYLSTTMKDVNGQTAVLAVAPVSTNHFSGVVVGEMDVQTYSNIIKNIVIGDTGNVFIIDKTGMMIANKRPQLVAQQQNFIEMAKTNSSYATSAEVYKKMTAGKTGVDTYAYETGTRICYYQPLTGTDGWSCGVVAPVSEMMSGLYTIIIGMVIAAVVLIAIGIWGASKLAKNVAAPIQKCSKRLLLLSQGDLHSEVPKVESKDETGDLARATDVLVNGLHTIIQDETRLLTALSDGNFDVFCECGQYAGDLKPIETSIQQIIDSLNNTFRQFNQSAEQVSGGSEQVSGGAQLLSQGATEQAGSVEELSASIKNLSDEIQKNADNAVISNQKAEKVGQKLIEGSRQVQSLTQAMDQIHNSSTKISKIIKTIQDIAFQTNILALNAAVEAAHAGEAGKGFSVVADEVRNLAGKSAQASKETSNLIAEMAQAVENGTGITTRTGQSLLSIVDDTKEIITTVSQISEASQKQADSIHRVTQSMEQISAVIQTNSATAEESAAASEELSGQASDMKQLVQQFQLREISAE